MPREIITIQVGQCGNQIATKFWDLALKEHSSRGVLFDDSMSSFFKNESGNSNNPILRSRALVVDTEEGVINNLMKSDLGELFDQKHFIKGVSGAGNNWAHGHFEYGPTYKDSILKKVNKLVEECDSPQCFMFTHSLGGGTGSGLGTYILKLLNENYPDLFKFSVCVFPSEDDDVVISPYNTMLALNELIDHSDCVMPIDNASLFEICNKVEKETKKGKDIIDSKKKPYDQMNSIIAHLLCNFTCSMRFEGSLNVDINDITMNLVPFPRLHFLSSSLSPLFHVLDKKLEPRKSDQIFSDIFHKDYQLISMSNFYNGTYLASALIARGDLSLSDINLNISKQKQKLKMVHWNHEGFKIGLCDHPPVGMKYGMLCLSNNTAISDCFSDIIERFNKLYKRKAHIHHYKEYMDQSQFGIAEENIVSLIREYSEVSFKQSNKNTKELINPFI